MIHIHALKCFVYSAEIAWRCAPGVSFSNFRFPIRSKKNWREIFVLLWIFEPVLFFQLFLKIHQSQMCKNRFVEMFVLFFFPFKAVAWHFTHLFWEPSENFTTSCSVSSFGAKKRRRYILPVLQVRTLKLALKCHKLECVLLQSPAKKTEPPVFRLRLLSIF